MRVRRARAGSTERSATGGRRARPGDGRRDGGPRVIVVGAGIAGLTAAFRLQQAGCDVTVMERGGPEQVGGRMSTVQREGFAVDVGATLLLASYRSMVRLICDAGLEEQVRPGGDVFGVVRDGEIQRMRLSARLRMPLSPFVRDLPTRDLVKVGRDFLRSRRRFQWHDMSATAPYDFESVRDYALRHGLHPSVYEYLLSPFVSDPSLAEPESSSVISAFFFLNTLIGSGGTFASPHGVGFLPQGLARHLHVVFDATVTSVEERREEARVSWTTGVDGEHTESADVCVLAVPPSQVPALHHDLTERQSEYLGSLRYARSIHIAFGADRRVAEKSLLLQVPRMEHPYLCSYVVEHNQVPGRVPEGTSLVMAHFRGTWSDDNWEMADSAVIDHALAATRRLGVLPELETHLTMAEVFRVDPCAVLRGPGDYREVARFRATLRDDARVQLAGGDLLAQSATNSSLCSGEDAATRVLRLLRLPRYDERAVSP